MPLRSRASNAVVARRSASADWMRAVSISAASNTSVWMSGRRIHAEPAITRPISAGTAASFTASQCASSRISPMPPVSSVLTTPSTASQLSLRRRQPSHRPHPTGKANASNRAREGPSRSSPLNCISTTAGSRIVTAISISGLGFFAVLVGVMGKRCSGVVRRLAAPGARGWDGSHAAPAEKIPFSLAACTAAAQECALTSFAHGHGCRPRRSQRLAAPRRLARRVVDAGAHSRTKLDRWIAGSLDRWIAGSPGRQWACWFKPSARRRSSLAA